MKEEVVLLFTGGFESLYNIHTLSKRYNIHLFYVNYGQENYSKEKDAINYYATEYKSVLSVKEISYLLDFPSLRSSSGEVTNVNVVGRNIIFLSMAVNYAHSIGVSKIAYGGVDLGKSWFDGGKRFFEATKEMFKKSYEITLLAPAMNIPFIKLAKTLNKVDYSHLTFCPDGRTLKRNCGVCDKCRNVITLLKEEKWSEEFLKKVMS